MTTAFRAKLDRLFLQKVDITDKQKQNLIDYYMEDIKKLEELLSIDLSNWYHDKK